MTTEEIIAGLEKAGTGISLQLAFMEKIVRRLREQEALIAELQKDRERVDKVEAGHANVWPQFVLSGEYGFVLSCFQLEYDVGSGATEDFPTWREAVDQAAKAGMEGQP